MKTEEKSSVTKPLLADLMAREAERKQLIATICNQPIQPADLAHDAGNGYNPGFVFPQE